MCGFEKYRNNEDLLEYEMEQDEEPPSLIDRLETIKAMVEWEYPLNFQITIDEVIEILREHGYA